MSDSTPLSVIATLQSALYALQAERDTLAAECAQAKRERDALAAARNVALERADRVENWASECVKGSQELAAHLSIATTAHSTLAIEVKRLEGLLGEACGLIDELTEDTPDRAHAVRMRRIKQETGLP